MHEVTRPWAWNRWLEQEGIILDSSLPGARFDQFNMVAQAARVGLGIALVPRFLFEVEIAAKELIVPFNRPVLGEFKYYFVYPHRNSANAIVLNFKDWLVETARGDRDHAREVPSADPDEATPSPVS